MSDGQRLTGVFLRVLSERAGREPTHQADLEERLAAAVASGRDAWPALALPDSEFACYLARRVPEGTDPCAWLQTARAADLYLACACANDVEGALAAFDARYLVPLGGALLRIDPSPAFADEVRQLVREKLFVASPRGPAKIAEYAGRGDLAGWVRTIAQRTALNLRRTGAGLVRGRDEDAAVQAVATAQDPELEYLQRRYQAEFKQAFRDALTALPSEQRNLLRFYMIDRLGIQEIGLLFRLSPSAVSRRLAAVREAVAEESRRLLRERLQLSEAGLESLAGLLRSRLDLSIAGALKDS